MVNKINYFVYYVTLKLILIPTHKMLLYILIAIYAAILQSLATGHGMKMPTILLHILIGLKVNQTKIRKPTKTMQN